jgi:hypothetical protein
MNIAGREHRLVAPNQVGLVETIQNQKLAVGKLTGYSRVHSKSLLDSGVVAGCYSLKPQKNREILSFFHENPAIDLREFASMRRKVTPPLRDSDAKIRARAV